MAFFKNIFDGKKEVGFFFKLGITNFSSLSKKMRCVTIESSNIYNRISLYVQKWKVRKIELRILEMTQLHVFMVSKSISEERITTY